MEKRIGVIGYKGRLGSELVFRGCFPIDCDLLDIKSIKDGIEEQSPDVIINCAAFTDVDACEKNIIKAYQINSFAPKTLVSCFDKKFIHISTDFIFDGNKDGGYNEDDIPFPINQYGYSKLFGEIGIKGYHDLLVVRTTVLYDAKSEKPNFVKSIYNKLKNKETITLPKLLGSPTYVPHLADGILYCIEKDLIGVINIVGKDILSRYEMGKRICQKFGFNSNLVQSGIAWGDAKRGEKLGLTTKKAESMGVPIYSFDQGLDEFGKIYGSRNS